MTNTTLTELDLSGDEIEMNEIHINEENTNVRIIRR